VKIRDLYLCGNLCDMPSTVSWPNSRLNNFPKRWSSHRGTWNKPDNKDGSDQMALWQHCSVFHGNDILIHYPSMTMNLTLLLLYNNPVWIPVKIIAWLSLTHKFIQSMIPPCVKQLYAPSRFLLMFSILLCPVVWPSWPPIHVILIPHFKTFRI